MTGPIHAKNGKAIPQSISTACILHIHTDECRLHLGRGQESFPTNYEIYCMAANLSFPLVCGPTAKHPIEQVLVYREPAPARFSCRFVDQLFTVRGIMKYRLKGIRLFVLNS
jgi:hypothetical protein